jgi:hypothetical protein
MLHYHVLFTYKFGTITCGCSNSTRDSHAVFYTWFFHRMRGMFTFAACSSWSSFNCIANDVKLYIWKKQKNLNEHEDQHFQQRVEFPCSPPPGKSVFSVAFTSLELGGRGLTFQRRTRQSSYSSSSESALVLETLGAINALPVVDPMEHVWYSCSAFDLCFTGKQYSCSVQSPCKMYSFSPLKNIWKGPFTLSFWLMWTSWPVTNVWVRNLHSTHSLLIYSFTSIKRRKLHGNKVKISSLLLVIDGAFDFVRFLSKPTTRFKVDDTFHSMRVINDLHLAIL